MRADDVRKVLVLGTGMMGPGISLLFAKAGYQVAMWGPNQAEAARGSCSYLKNLNDLVREGLMSQEEADLAFANCTSSCDLARSVVDADFVIEAVVENLEIKQELFAQLETLCPSHAVLASNTSTLLPSDLAVKMRDKERMLVAHFWNPAHLVPLVEVCGSLQTSPETIELTMDLLRRVGKEPVLMKKEILGFIGNRLMHALNREAISLVEKGIADPEDIDKVVLGSFGPRFACLGPLEYLDFVGLDHVSRIQAYLYADLDVTGGQQSLLLEKTRRGEVGIKAGRGLFDWSRRDPDGPQDRRDAEFLRRLKARRSTAG